MTKSRLLFLSFWGHEWQDSAGRAQADTIVQTLAERGTYSGSWVVAQASFYTHAGWVDGTRSTILSVPFVAASIQDMLDRGTIGESDGDNSKPDIVFVIFLDKKLTLFRRGREPDGARRGHFTTKRGNPFRYGLIPHIPDNSLNDDEAPAGRYAAQTAGVIAAIDAGPSPEGVWTPVSEPTKTDNATDRIHTPPIWPSLYIERRMPRFRFDDAELERFLGNLMGSLDIHEFPGAAAMLRRAGTLVDAKLTDQAQRPRPASDIELCDFTNPIPRVTMAERLAAMRSRLGDQDPDAIMVGELLANVCEPVLADLRRTYFEDGAFGFVDVVFWTYRKLQFVKSLGLHAGKPLSIWDIGCGGGHFSLVCAHFGHDVLGTDQEHPVYKGIAAALGVARTIDLIRANKPTTDFGRKFDLVTANQIEFDHLYNPPRPWTLDQWKFLLNDLMQRQLNYPGRIHLALNYQRHNGKAAFDVDLMRLCARNGAEVNERAGIVDWSLAAPVHL